MSDAGSPLGAGTGQAPASPWRAAVLAAIVAAGAIAVYASPLHRLLSLSGVAEMRGWIVSTGSWAPGAFVLATAGGVAFGAPRLLFAAVAGLAFGWLAGTALALVGTLAGCLVTFGYARRLGRSWIQTRRGSRLERIDGAFRNHGILASLAIRAAPIGNCHAANLLMAVSPISLRDFVVGTTLGILPETVIYSLFASAATQGSIGSGLKRAVVAGMLIVSLGTLHLLIVRRSAVARDVVSTLAKENP